MGDGISVPVDERDEADELSSSTLWALVSIGSDIGASDGNLANLDLANDFWSSLIECGVARQYSRPKLF